MAVTVKKTFSRETSVSVDIGADPSVIWVLLTNASDYPRWNSTILSIVGDIVPGQTVRLRSTLDPKRSFRLKIKKFEPDRVLTWGNAMGTRDYLLEKKSKDKTRFTMREKIGSPVFPFFASMIPSFDQSFDQFASDLKREAEAIANK